MSKYPLRGEGIEIRRNKAESEEDRRKYNIHVHPRLFAMLQGDWEEDETTGRRVFGYEATDEDFELAKGDHRCH